MTEPKLGVAMNGANGGQCWITVKEPGAVFGQGLGTVAATDTTLSTNKMLCYFP